MQLVERGYAVTKGSTVAPRSILDFIWKSLYRFGEMSQSCRRAYLVKRKMSWLGFFLYSVDKTN